MKIARAQPTVRVTNPLRSGSDGRSVDMTMKGAVNSTIVALYACERCMLNKGCMPNKKIYDEFLVLQTIR